MTDHAGSEARDFAFQSTDQAFANHPLGRAESAATSTTTYNPQSHDHYNVESNTNASGATSSSNQASAANPSLRFPDFDTHQSSISPQGAPQQYPNYGFSPGGPLGWDWTNSIDFQEFANHYEPQGELVQELQSQNAPNSDFSIPLPIAATENRYQSQPKVQPSKSAPPQNPLSPPPKPPQRPVVQTGMKRKAESEPNSAVSQGAGASAELQQNPAKRANNSRSSSSVSDPSPTAAAATAKDAQPPSMTQATAASVANAEASQSSKSQTNNEAPRASKGTGPQGRVIDVSKPRRVVETPSGVDILPAGKVFPIQIGSELFRLSGASISSDAPSYFSHFFAEQLHNNNGLARDVRTLYIDRDPETFRDIALHLQGYHIIPRDGEHFVKLFADAQFYSLPRLTKQLFSTDIFIRIGGTPFQIPRDLFSSPGDSPNFFSLGFAQFFSTPSEVFPGLDRNALLRPPSIQPPALPNMNGEIFGELVKMLQGYNVEVRNETHRAQLLKDARWFHLKGLEQKLIPCEKSFNLARQQSEILIRLEDMKQSGVSFTPDSASASSNSDSGAASTMEVSPAPAASKPASPALSQSSTSQSRAGYVSYARPYIDDPSHTNTLILEISTPESTTLHFPFNPPISSSRAAPLALNLRATFRSTTLARITSLFSVVASKMGLPATQPLGLMLLQSGGGVAAQPVSPANSGVSERRVRVRIDSDCHLDIDNSPAELAVDPESGRMGIRRVHASRPNKRAKISGDRHDYDDDDAALSKNDWMWGGARLQDPSTLGLGVDGEEQEEEWIIQRAHWRLRVEPLGSADGDGRRMQVVLCGVRLEGYSKEKSRNRERGFLGSV